jgi:hypothetical protein
MTTIQSPPPAGNTSPDANPPPAVTPPEIQTLRIGALQVPDVVGGFTRRCGKRDPVDKSLCLYAYGHKGRHAWELAYITEHWREWGSNMTEKSGPGAGSRGRL